MENSISHPLGTPTVVSSQKLKQTIPPLPRLISSVLSSSSHLDSSSPSLEDNHHLMVVVKLVGVLSRSSSKDQKVEDASLLDDDGASESTMEPEDDMVLGQFQKDAKLEALARRSPSKESSRPKKGRKTSFS